MDVAIHDIQSITAEWRTRSGISWVKMRVIDGGYVGEENRNEFTLYFPTATTAAAFANAVNSAMERAANFVVIEPA